MDPIDLKPPRGGISPLATDYGMWPATVHQKQREGFMKSPLAVDKATVTKYKIPKSVELHPLQKIAFLEDQLEQIKTMHWRSRVDLLHDQRLIDSDNAVLRNKGLQNQSTHLNEVEQTIGAIELLDKLIGEVKSENPGLEAKPDYSA